MWIAFKNLYLWYSEQLRRQLQQRQSCCELLSKTCIFDILNNHLFSLASPILLWIAFKNLYLWYSEQPYLFDNVIWFCCELLSKTCIFDILNNNANVLYLIIEVVNCFQKLVSLIFWTTVNGIGNDRWTLWIAFKNLYLWYSEQPTKRNWKSINSCELLSKTCIFDILNNTLCHRRFIIHVVNCFQKLVSLIFWTTEGHILLGVGTLWIAFKNLYLWYSEQHMLMEPQPYRCCELLSKTCIFDILNNICLK